MSRTGLHRPRLSRAASRRPAPGTRLLPGSFLFPHPVLHPNTHYKRCPKAQRLGLRSDQSPPRPMQGRSPDKSRHVLFKGRCQVRAPLIGRNGFAPSGDAKEHGVMLLHRAIAPFLDSTVVTIGKFRSTNGGHGSMLSPLGVLERFRWSRLPQSESFSRLVHIPSEVWGCRRVDAGVDRPQGQTPRIGTGVADILRKPSGTFLPLPRLAMSSRGPARDLKGPSQDVAFTTVHPHPTSGSVRGAASRTLEEWAGMRLMPSPPTSTNPRFAMSSRGPARDLKRPPQDMAFTAVHPHPTSGNVRGTASRTLKEWAGMRLMSSPPTRTKLGASACARAQALAPVFPSLSPLKALRACPESLEGESRIKRVRVPLSFLKQSKACLKPENNQKPAPSPSSFPTPIGNPPPGAGPLVLRLSKYERRGGPHPTVTSRWSSSPTPCRRLPHSATRNPPKPL